MNRFAGSFAALLAAAPGIAAAQNVPCLERDAALRHLGSEYNESPVAMGLTSNGAVLEVLSSKTGENWTIIVTMPNGTTCLIAAGKSWEKVPRLVQNGPQT